MRTIASEVTNYIKTKPFLSTALSQGIINLTSLAREIQPSSALKTKIELDQFIKSNVESAYHPWCLVTFKVHRLALLLCII